MESNNLNNVVNKNQKRILVVDDDSNIRYLLKEILTDRGHHVIEARNGLEGLEKYDTNIDLVFTDAEMPEMNGFEFIKKLKSIYQDVKVILMSGSNPHTIEKIAPHASAYMKKPFKIKSEEQPTKKQGYVQLPSLEYALNTYL